MKIQSIELKNFRGISDISFDLSDKLNVFVGVNGSGKSSILDALGISLSWLVNRIQRDGSSGKPITTTSIKNDTTIASIKVEILESNLLFSWKVTRTPFGSNNSEKSELTGASDLANYYQSIYNKEGALPVIVYYPINRIVGNIPSNISSKESLSLLDVYDNALGGQTNYQAFFEWFRLQDDIVNERANSRTKWIANNKNWVRRKTSKLLSYFEDLVNPINEEDADFKEMIKRRFGRENYIYEEPRYLFSGLSEVLQFVQFSKRKNGEFVDIFHDLDYMLHKMGSLSDSGKDNLIEFNNYPFEIVWQVLKQITRLKEIGPLNNESSKMIMFIWDALLFAVLLSLWWLSDKGKKEIEVLFSENNPIKFSNTYKTSSTEPEYFMSDLENVVKNDAARYDKATKSQGRELSFVTKTIEDFIPGYSNLRVTRVPRPQLLVDKNGETMSLDQLSDGEKNLIALVGDIARRLSIANSNNKNPLTGNGIILIDEIDLHLHPAWQRLMIPRLTALFPNCQFIITTHSPQVLSHTKSDNIFLLKSNNGELTYSKATESYGKNSDRILEDLLEVDARPKNVKDLIHNLFVSIQDGALEDAKNQINDLIASIGEDTELIKARTLIKRKEILGK